LLYATSVEKLFEMTDMFLQRVHDVGLRLNIRKCTLFDREIEFCGRIFSKDSWKFKPEFFKNVEKLPRPCKVHELMDVIYVCQWLANSIPRFAEVRDKLSGSLERAGMTKKELRQKNLDIPWDKPGLVEAWILFRKLLSNSAEKSLKNYDHTKELLLLTDASKDYWAGAIMRIQPLTDETTKLEFDTMEPEPLMFFSGKFTKSQKKWHITQKEMYPIIYIFNRVDFLLKNPSKTVNIGTDHQALKYILNPKLTKNKNHSERLSRWALTIQSVRTRIFHVPAAQNKFADLLSRWGYIDNDMKHGFNKRNKNEIESENTGQEELSPEDENEVTAHFIAMRSERYKEETVMGVETADREAMIVTTQIIEELVSIDLDAFTTVVPDIEQEQYRIQNARIVHDSALYPHIDEELRAIEVCEGRRSFPVQNELAEIYKDIRAVDLRNLGDMIMNQMKYDEVSFLNPYYAGQYHILTEQRIMQYQQDAGIIPVDESRLKTDAGRIILPYTAIPHLMASVHVQNFHGSEEQDLISLRRYVVIWRNQYISLKKYLKAYRRTCLHCQRRPYLLRTPFNKTLMGKSPRDVIRMDYLKVNEYGSILVIIDTFSRKTLLHHTMKQTAEEAVKALLKWRANYLFRNQFLLITDNGAHFANRLMKKLFTKLRGTHKFSVAYAPWTNGSCENKNSHILKIIRQMRSELRLNKDEWPDILPEIEFVINNTRISSRNGYTANQLFLRMTDEEISEEDNMLIKPDGLELRYTNLSRIMQSLADNFHRNVFDKREKEVYDAINLSRNLWNRKSAVNLTIQFKLGEYVLYSIRGKPNHHDKSSLTWVGPVRVTGILGENVYELTKLDGQVLSPVHANRMWFYHGNGYVPKSYIEKVCRFNWEGLEIESIKRIGVGKRGEIWIEIQWFGFEELTKESIDDVLQGAHRLLAQFAEDNKKRMKKAIYKEVMRKVHERQRELAETDEVGSVGNISLDSGSSGDSSELIEDELYSTAAQILEPDIAGVQLETSALSTDDMRRRYVQEYLNEIYLSTKGQVDKEYSEWEERLAHYNHELNHRKALEEFADSVDWIEAEPSNFFIDESSTITRFATMSCNIFANGEGNEKEFSKERYIDVDYPTYLKQWTEAEIRRLRNILQVIPVGNFGVLHKKFKGKSRVQLRAMVMVLCGGKDAYKKNLGHTLDSPLEFSYDTAYRSLDADEQDIGKLPVVRKTQRKTRNKWTENSEVIKKLIKNALKDRGPEERIEKMIEIVSENGRIRINKVAENIYNIHLKSKGDTQKLLDYKFRIAYREAPQYPKLRDAVWDIVIIDPNWTRPGRNKNQRTVYKEIEDRIEESLGKLGKVQVNDILGIWTINTSIEATLSYLRNNGYKHIRWMDLVKVHPSTGKLKKSKGFFMQRSKQSLILGVRPHCIEKLDTAWGIHPDGSFKQDRKYRPTSFVRTVQKEQKSDAPMRELSSILNTGNSKLTIELNPVTRRYQSTKYLGCYLHTSDLQKLRKKLTVYQTVQHYLRKLQRTKIECNQEIKRYREGLKRRAEVREQKIK